MELIIQEIAEAIRVEFAGELQRLLIEERDISEFIMGTKTMLDEIGVKLVAEALETLDQAVKESADRKRTWLVKSKKDIKNMATIFGEVSYSRTYYQNKKTGEYSYLSDELVGIAAHDKLDTSLQAKLIEEAIDMPYRRSGKKAAEAVELTSQTVMNSIRRLGSVDNNAAKIKDKGKIVKTLYIEADEDHVALQDGKCAEPKLVYVHEGINQVGKERWELLNPRYFSGIYTNSDELWLEVADYIDETYDANSIEKIYLSGDGASWIKNGLGWIKRSIYVLDRYHLSKYITKATAHIEDSAPVMWKYINHGEKEKVKELFTVIIRATETDTKKKSVREARSYILGNWDGIKNQYEPDYVGCSAEGHVSHILSARLSSRPLGWCKTGVDQMARLRAFKANGGIVYDFLLAQKRRVLSKARKIKIDQDILMKRNLAATSETFGNIAILNKGKKTATLQFLRSIRTA